MTEISNIMVYSYPLPLVKDGYRISLYLYKESDVHDILFSKYYEHFPKGMLADDPSLAVLDKFCIDMEDEFVIFINEGVGSPRERLGALVESLFHTTMDIADAMDSEEYGARLIGDAFKMMAPLVDPGLASSPASCMRGQGLSEYALPLMSEGYRVTFNMYDEATVQETRMKLRDVYKEKMLSGGFNPANNYGFVVEPDADELGVFMNCERTEGLLPQFVILVHELFHASMKVTRTFDDSAMVGARLCRALFRQFSEAMEAE